MTDIAWIDLALASARPKALGALLRYFRNLDTAEEAFQEACLRAIRTWPEKGPPRDPTAWLTVSAAIDWHSQAGGRSLTERNAKLVQQAAQELAERWKTGIGVAANAAISMKAVRLPFGEPTRDAAQRLRLALLDDHRLDTVIVAFANSLWIRLSAQAYNSLPDYRRLGDVISERAGARTR
mgnify:CR=1 FL=1